MTSADDARSASGRPDLDLLADYLAGALDGPAARRVEAITDTDPTWAATLRELRRADADVREALAGPGAATEPMPDDVFDRIMAALPVDRAPGAAAPAADPARGGLRGWNALRGGADRPARATPPAGLTGAGPTGSAGTHPPGRSGVTAPLDRDDRRAARRSSRHPGRRLPLAGLAVLVLAVVAIFGGVITLANHGSNKSTASSEAGIPPAATNDRNNPAPQPLSTPATSIDGVTVYASGTDYTFGSLGGIGATNGFGGSQSFSEPGATGGKVPLGSLTLPDLARLADPGQLATCLSAVTAQFGAPPVSADFARYDGSAAVILALPAAHLVVVVGPECGEPGSGADEITHTTLH